MLNFRFKLVIFSFVFVLFISNNLFSQSDEEKNSSFNVNFGADIVNRYVWRGMEFGGSPAVPNIQPYFGISYNLDKAGIIEIGGWGSYGLTGNYSENDLYLKYVKPTESAGTLSLTFNDYYFPYLGINFNNFEGKGIGAHTIDFVFEYTGPNKFPVSLLVSNLLHNDLPENKSLYLELGYSFSVKNVSAKVFFGAAKGVSSWQLISTNKFEFSNIGLNLSKSLKITEDYSLPLGVSYILNWHLKKSYLVFKVSF